MRNAFAIALAAALITTSAIKAAPALAETPVGETNVSVVRTADLDLSSKVGRRQLDLRIARAAREVCGIASDADLRGRNAARRCRDEVLDRARDARLAAAGRDSPIVVAAR